MTSPTYLLLARQTVKLLIVVEQIHTWTSNADTRMSAILTTIVAYLIPHDRVKAAQYFSRVSIRVLEKIDFFLFSLVFFFEFFY